jgi:hypothetical protein
MSSEEVATTPDVLSLRPFVPATDFQACLAFYGELGFTARPLGDGLASMELGPFAFLLQAYQGKDFAQHFMLHLLVKDLAAWWRRIEALDLAARYDVPAPRAPALQPWGLVVAYLVDPTGVLWHIAQARDR